MELTFGKYNFTYDSKFQALGLQGEATYWFAGNIQTRVCLPLPHARHACTQRFMAGAVAPALSVCGCWLDMHGDPACCLCRWFWGASRGAATMGCVARAVAARAVFATVVTQVSIGDILNIGDILKPLLQV